MAEYLETDEHSRDGRSLERRLERSAFFELLQAAMASDDAIETMIFVDEEGECIDFCSSDSPEYARFWGASLVSVAGRSAEAAGRRLRSCSLRTANKEASWSSVMQETTQGSGDTADSTQVGSTTGHVRMALQGGHGVVSVRVAGGRPRLRRLQVSLLAASLCTEAGLEVSS